MAEDRSPVRLPRMFSNALSRAKRLTGQGKRGTNASCAAKACAGEVEGDASMSAFSREGSHGGSEHLRPGSAGSGSEASTVSRMDPDVPCGAGHKVDSGGSSGDETADMSVSGGTRASSEHQPLAGPTGSSEMFAPDDVRLSFESNVSSLEQRDVCPDELVPPRPSRRGSMHSTGCSSGRRSSEAGRSSGAGRSGCSRDSRGSIDDSYASRPSWEMGGSLDGDVAKGTRSEDWAHVFQGNEARGVPNGVPRASEQRDSVHSYYSRSSAEVPFEAVLTSSLYSETPSLPTLTPATRRASANDACGDTAPAPAARRATASSDWPRRPPQHARPDVPTQQRSKGCYVDSLSLEEEAAAIVSPATRLAIAQDGIKYRSLARSSADRHKHHREPATNAQLARAAFNLPSVRDVEHHRCRTQFRTGVQPQ